MEVNGISAGNFASYIDLGVQIFRNTILGSRYFFASSYLYRPQTIVEKIARIRDSRFSDREIPYARKVTVAWSIFFAINGLIALATVLIENKFYWSIYNGAISYALMGFMFAGEFYCRKRFLKSA